MAEHFSWVTFCRRTEDPKLAFIEGMLTARGIPHRRHGASFHAPILQVPQEHEEAAWAMLSEKLPRRRVDLDSMPDDHKAFAGCTPSDWTPDDEEEEHDEMAELTRAALSRGRP